MAKKDLLKEAIADAEMLKKVAIENAKKTLNETFEPKIKELLAKKLNEEAEEDEEDIDEAKDIPADDEDAEDVTEQTDETCDTDDEDMDESIDIDAILAEMDGSDDEEEPVDEVKKEIPGEEDEDGSVDEEIDLNQLLGELDEKKKAEPVADEDEDEPSADDEPIDEAGDPVLAELHQLSARVNEAIKKYSKKDKAPVEDEVPATELQEARKIAKLTEKISETNLLNAKLLYLNKVLKENNLDSKQKIKIINAFDKATTVSEAKLVYTSLSEAFKVKAKKNTLKESLGSIASKPVGTSTKGRKKDDIIDEATYNRWQKLSGLLD